MSRTDGPHRPPTVAARRAALDAWEAELRRGVAGRGSPHPVVGALVHAAERHDLPLDELGPYMCSMRVDCGPVRPPLPGLAPGTAAALREDLERIGFFDWIREPEAS